MRFTVPILTLASAAMRVVAHMAILVVIGLTACSSEDSTTDATEELVDGDSGGPGSSAPSVPDCLTVCERSRSLCGGNGLGYCPRYCERYPVEYRECVMNVPSSMERSRACRAAVCCSCPYNSHCGRSYEACLGGNP